MRTARRGRPSRIAALAVAVATVVTVACARGARSEDGAGASAGAADPATAESATADPSRPPAPEPAGTAAVDGPPGGAAAPPRDKGRPRTGVDTMRGVVSITGSEPMTSVVLTPPQGEPVVVQGVSEAVLRNADGLEVRVEGRRTGARAVGAGARPSAVFEARAFVVRALDGEPAIDGVLERSPGGFALRTADGRVRPIPSLPDGLRDRVGARVYLVGPSGAVPSSYGVLAPRR